MSIGRSINNGNDIEPDWDEVTEKKRENENLIIDKILEVANLYNEVTTSDLQGIAAVTAKEIIKLIKEA